MNNPINITLHIERLVLDGLTFSAYERGQLQTALQTELSRLLTEGGLSPALQAGGAMPSLNVPAIQMTSANPTVLGQQIAQSIYGGLSSETNR